MGGNIEEKYQEVRKKKNSKDNNSTQNTAMGCIKRKLLFKAEEKKNCCLKSKLLADAVKKKQVASHTADKKNQPTTLEKNQNPA